MNCQKPYKLDIEQYFTGELVPSQVQFLETHFESCGTCRDYRDSLERKKRAFLQVHPYSAFSGAGASEATVPWWDRLRQLLLRPALVPAYSALLLALIAVPMLLRRGAVPETASGDIIYKGGPDLAFICRRGGQVAEGRPDGAYHPGDEIQVLYTAAGYKHIALLSLDSRGRLSFYDPDAAGPVASVKTEWGARAAYPSSIRLDATPGHELVIAVFANDRLQRQDLQKWAAGQTRRYAGDADGIAAALTAGGFGPGTVMKWILLRKGSGNGSIAKKP